MQVQFGPGAPTLFKIPWTDSTEAALGAGVSWQDTDRLRRKRGNQMCHRLFFFFFSCKSKVTLPSQEGDGFQAIKGASFSRGSARLENSALCAPSKFYLVSKEADAAASAIPAHRQQMTAPKIARQFVEPSLAGQRAGGGH